MKHFFVNLITATLLISSCNSKKSNTYTEASPVITETASNLLNYKDGEKPLSRLFPDKLRDLPNEITAAHYPNPCYATFQDSMYIWKHNTTIQTKEDLQIIEYGSFVYHRKRMVFKNYYVSKRF